jgi:hypothetical protein
MTNLDIFKIGGAVMGTFKKFEKVGDQVQGTYIDLSEGRDSYENEQVIVTLRDSEGANWKVGIKKTNTILLDQVNKLNLGQIVGFRFDEQKASKRNPGKMANIIRLYADSAVYDEAWLKERSEKYNGINHVVISPTDQDAPFPSASDSQLGGSTPVQGAIPTIGIEKFAAIMALAVTKGIITETMTDRKSVV